MAKRKSSLLTLICLLFLVSLSFLFGCSHNEHQNLIPDNNPEKANLDASEIDPVEPPLETEKPSPDQPLAEARAKYYHYFNKHNSRIYPLFPYTGKLDKNTESDLMTFAILNLKNYSYEAGNSQEEIDAVLKKYFGQTVNNYNTSISESVPGTQKIRATGWSFHGGLRLVLTKLVAEEDGSLTGSFDVYYIPEMYYEDDPEGWKNLDTILLSNNRVQYAKLLSSKAIINFNEITEADGGFYLKYNTIKVLEMESPVIGLYAGYEFDERTFEPTARFSAAEATFNGISTKTTEKQLIDQLGEPFEILADPSAVYLPTTTYVYAGVEYVFEGDMDTVAYIMVTNYQWKYGPRNIRIGDDFEDVLARFPQEQDYKTHPESCFYGETTYHHEGGAVYLDNEGNIDHITVVPKEVLPFMKIYFRDNKVSSYIIYGSTT